MIDCSVIDGPVVLNGSKKVSTTAAGAHHSTKKCANMRTVPPPALPPFWMRMNRRAAARLTEPTATP